MVLQLKIKAMGGGIRHTNPFPITPVGSRVIIFIIFDIPCHSKSNHLSANFIGLIFFSEL